MLPTIHQHQPALETLCRQFGVRKLEVFGSATTDLFGPQHSDIDFLVEFEPNYNLGPWMKNYFALQDALSELLQRKVDLVFADSVKNPYLIRAINQSRQLIYASQNPEIA
jgi:uncharacterized protein